MHIQFRSLLFTVLVFLFVASCSKDTVEPEKSRDNDLAGLSITKSANPSFSEDAYVFRFREAYYVTLPEGADLSQVEIDFDVHERAAVVVNDRLINGQKGRFNLNETLSVEVTAEA